MSPQSILIDYDWQRGGPQGQTGLGMDASWNADDGAVGTGVMRGGGEGDASRPGTLYMTFQMH